MFCVGNDIVDREEKDARGKSGDAAFVQRILTDEERRRWEEASRRDGVLWLFWAAKEGAYKVQSKIQPGWPFIPRRFEVSFPGLTLEGLESPAAHRGEILADGKKIPCQARVTREYIHVLAVWPPSALPGVITEVRRMEHDGHEPPDESQQVRDFARAAIARHYRWEPADLDIRRFPRGNKWGPPLLFHQGKAGAGDLSLSHDGRFMAYAFRRGHPGSAAGEACGGEMLSGFLRDRQT